MAQPIEREPVVEPSLEVPTAQAAPKKLRTPTLSGVRSMLSRRTELFLPLPIVLLLLMGAAAFQLRQQSDRNTQNIALHRGALDAVAALMTALDDAETGQRGFLLTGQEEYLEPFKTGAVHTTEQLATLQQALALNPRQRVRVETIQSLIQRKFAELDLTITLFRRSGLAAAQRVVKTGEGKQLMTRIQSICRLIESVESAQLTEASIAMERTVRQTILVTTIGGAALFALLLLTLVIIRSSNRQLDSHIEALAKHQSYTRTLIESSFDAMIVTDIGGIITDLNKQMEQLAARPRGALIGTSFASHFKDQVRAQTCLDRLLAQGKLADYELVARASDNREASVSCNGTTFSDNEGGFHGALVVARDVTERKLLERLQHENNLELRARGIQLQALNKELEDFTYIAAHDLKGPLRAIENSSKWLEEDLQDHLTDETRANMNLLRGRVKRMDKLLDDLVEYVRIGRVTDNRYTDLVSGDLLINDVLALLPTRSFALTVSPNFSAIQLPRMPLQLILINLVGNAIKHHDKETGCIDVSLEIADECYTFAVRDDGPGIPEQFRNRVFEIFQTLKPRDQIEGSGMGLAMVRKSIDVFGGMLWLESAGERGSIFRFTWPRLQKPANEMLRAHRAASL